MFVLARLVSTSHLEGESTHLPPMECDAYLTDKALPKNWVDKNPPSPSTER
jgi:hypothetical protein